MRTHCVCATGEYVDGNKLWNVWKGWVVEGGIEIEKLQFHSVGILEFTLLRKRRCSKAAKVKCRKGSLLWSGLLNAESSSVAANWQKPSGSLSLRGFLLPSLPSSASSRRQLLWLWSVNHCGALKSMQWSGALSKASGVGLRCESV